MAIKYLAMPLNVITCDPGTVLAEYFYVSESANVEKSSVLYDHMGKKLCRRQIVASSN